MHKSYLIERIRWVAVVLSCLSLFQNLHSAGLSELRLKYRGDASEQTFSFDEHQGRIVVLDFFAYWCAPCLKTSPLIEEGIAEYYSSKNGNPQGVPVDVIAVNVETSNSKSTDLFIRRTGLKKIIDDSLAASYGQF